MTAQLSFRQNNLEVSTTGLLRRGMPEVRISVETASLVPECEIFLEFTAKYQFETGKRIKAGETMNYGYWLVKFERVNDDLLEVWEYNNEGTDFVRGGSLALRYWRDQHRICGANSAEFNPPRPDKLTAVSVGVMEGLPVQGVRYPWQEHMSGWLIVTERWDGNITSLLYEHTYHVTGRRSDLARYLALPIGFRFDLTNGERVWLDEEVARQEPA